MEESSYFIEMPGYALNYALTKILLDYLPNCSYMVEIFHEICESSKLTTYS